MVRLLSALDQICVLAVLISELPYSDIDAHRDIDCITVPSVQSLSRHKNVATLRGRLVTIQQQNLDLHYVFKYL